MVVLHHKKFRPSVMCHICVDDYGNEIFIGGTDSSYRAWYFLGIYRALVKEHFGVE